MSGTLTTRFIADSSDLIAVKSLILIFFFPAKSRHDFKKHANNIISYRFDAIILL